MDEIYLTAAEQERERVRATKAMRTRLEQSKPELSQYLTETGRTGQLIVQTLQLAKLSVPVIALLAAAASSVRTVQTASEIYSASGSHPVGVALAAIAFTVSVEGALFTLALASEGEKLKRKAENQTRHVFSVRGLWFALRVRLGLEEPLSYDELPTGIDMGSVMAIAFLFAVAANAYIGFRPLLDEIGTVSLQEFFATLWSAPARLQLTFIVDLVGILFPPLMALAAGHLTAHFAAEIADQSQTAQAAYEAALTAWRDAYTNPLDTEEGGELLEQYLRDKHRAKVRRAKGRDARFLAANGIRAD